MAVLKVQGESGRTGPPFEAGPPFPSTMDFNYLRAIGLSVGVSDLDKPCGLMLLQEVGCSHVIFAFEPRWPRRGRSCSSAERPHSSRDSHRCWHSVCSQGAGTLLDEQGLARRRRQPTSTLCPFPRQSAVLSCFSYFPKTPMSAVGGADRRGPGRVGVRQRRV